jgi:hypothetical protein
LARSDRSGPIELLAARYPVIRRLVGELSFRVAARRFILSHDVMPVLSSAPALAVSAAVDSGSVEAVETLRHDDFAQQNGLQHA